MSNRRLADQRLVPVTLAVGAIYVVVFSIVRSQLLVRAPGLVGAAATFDLTVTAALATWLIGLQRRTAFLVAAMGFVAARLLLPENAREGLLAMRLGWVACIVLLVPRARQLLASELRILNLAL